MPKLSKHAALTYAQGSTGESLKNDKPQQERSLGEKLLKNKHVSGRKEKRRELKAFEKYQKERGIMLITLGKWEKYFKELLAEHITEFGNNGGRP